MKNLIIFTIVLIFTSCTKEVDKPFPLNHWIRLKGVDPSQIPYYVQTGLHTYRHTDTIFKYPAYTVSLYNGDVGYIYNVKDADSVVWQIHSQNLKDEGAK